MVESEVGEGMAGGEQGTDHADCGKDVGFYPEYGNGNHHRV